MKFIYVFNKVHADILTADGYKLINHNDKQSMWVFENSSHMNFSKTHSFPYVLSNNMTF